MDPLKLYSLLQELPFPIRVLLRDGRSYEVAARGFAVVGKSYLDIGSQTSNGPPGFWEHITTLQLQDISSVEALPPSASAKRAGVMISAAFQELLQRKPFEPFRLHLSNGAVHEIRLPELAVLRFSVVWLHLPAKDLPIPVGETRVIVDLGQILFLDFLPPQGASSSNGP